MMTTYKQIKKLGSGGLYYSIDDGKYFGKQRDSLELISKEYNNLLHVQDINIKGLKFPKPVHLDVEKKMMVSEYIDGKSLIEEPKEGLYLRFGQVLNQMHKSGLTHGHLQFNDVVYKDPDFYLTDLVRVNECESSSDLANLMMSVRLFGVKRWWKAKTYDKCWELFLNGYDNFDKYHLELEYNRIRNKLITQRGLRGFKFKLLHKFGLI